MMTRWWKCDLQVATPGAHDFRGEAGWNLADENGRVAAAEQYIDRAVAAGLEVLVLADHNSSDWVDLMVAAGAHREVTVFPGFELTSGSGADGVHVVIFGPPETTGEHLRRLLYGCCGFSDDHPCFDPNDPDAPVASPRTLPQILDDLPERFLAIAPHAFNDNGIASGRTMKGSLRWKALHHARLGAIDVGDLRQLPDDSSWRSRFARRQLNDFPCLPDLPFVATSDAYSLDAFGSRFTWIRMAEPSIEAMRQAFLDHQARIICDWDQRYADGAQTPNDVTHGWVDSLSLTSLSTASTPLKVTFDPRLTVLIGGRGSGKSTVVAGLRLLYGDVDSLPAAARAEAIQLRDAVFSGAVATGSHHLAHSGEQQTTTWSATQGSSTSRADGRQTPTDFKVRVIGQKELFERAANSSDNPFATSRNLLRLVDDALSARGQVLGDRRAFGASVDELRTRWVAAVRQLDAERTSVSQIDSVSERVAELRRQVEAFDSEESRARRQHNDRLAEEARQMNASHQGLMSAIAELRDKGEDALERDRRGLGNPASESGAAPVVEHTMGLLSEVRDDVLGVLRETCDEGLGRLEALYADQQLKDWREQLGVGAADAEAYAIELKALGLDPDAYARVRDQLDAQEATLRELLELRAGLPALEQAANIAWSELELLHDQRRGQRQRLLEDVQSRSNILRFRVQQATDTVSWVESVRVLLSIRSDGFLEEVPALAAWLWKDQVGRDDRLQLWRDACISGDFDMVGQRANMRSAWIARLRNLDPLVRTRLAAEVAEDVVAMDFLRERGNVESEQDWQPLTTGSPGQRSAAMLGFVLHQGDEPLVLDQPEDDLDTEWISELVVRQLRHSRWIRQVIVVTHNANIPVNADAERVVVLESGSDGIRVRTSEPAPENGSVEHCGPIENSLVRADIQRIMEGGVDAFVRRERRYNNELNSYRVAMQQRAQEPTAQESGTP